MINILFSSFDTMTTCDGCDLCCYLNAKRKFLSYPAAYYPTTNGTITEDKLYASKSEAIQAAQKYQEQYCSLYKQKTK